MTTTDTATRDGRRTSYRGLWLAFVVVVIGSFAVLLATGRHIDREKPPIPDRVTTADGDIVVTGRQIRNGQSVWQSLGGHEIGSVWGHGAYVAPDWTADWLHREATLVLDAYAGVEEGADYADLDPERQAALRQRLAGAFRTNTYDDTARTVEVDDGPRQARGPQPGFPEQAGVLTFASTEAACGVAR